MVVIVAVLVVMFPSASFALTVTVVSPVGSPLTVQLQVLPVTVTGLTVADWVLTVTVGVTPDSTVPEMVWTAPDFAGVFTERERDGGVLSRKISAFFTVTFPAGS